MCVRERENIYNIVYEKRRESIYVLFWEALIVFATMDQEGFAFYFVVEKEG